SSVPSCSSACVVRFFLRLRPPPSSPLFPYTTLFRSPARVPVSAGGRGPPGLRRRRLLLGRRHPGPAPAAAALERQPGRLRARPGDRKSTRLNSSHGSISYAVFCLKKKKTENLQLYAT